MKYSVTIKLDTPTLNALKNGFQLQVFKGVKSANAASGIPTVWHSVDSFASTVKISWEEKYGGYFSDTKTEAGVTVDVSTQASMLAKDVITLSDAGSASVSTIGGVDGAFAFESKQKTTWTSGLLSAPEGGTLAPICAFPQYGAFGNVIAPYEKVLLLFTQKQRDTGTVVETAISTSVSIILSTITPSMEVDFDINKGWDTHGKVEATANPINFHLAQDLIIPSPTLRNKLEEMKMLLANA